MAVTISFCGTEDEQQTNSLLNFFMKLDVISQDDYTYMMLGPKIFKPGYYSTLTDTMTWQ
jgi:hypothetical protein